MKKLKELLFIKSIKGIGKTTIYKKYWAALSECEGIEDLSRELTFINPQISDTLIEDAKKKAEKIYRTILDNPEVKVITVFDDTYPKQLLVMENKKPLMLYVKGDSSILERPNIAVIGTRKISEWSAKVETKLVKKIIELSDRVIVSGLALGCDAIAHKATILAGKPTIAVLPSGINSIYPSANKPLAEEIINRGGCLVSEYDLDTKVTKTTPIERDAIVAALSDALYVIECAEKSGTMHTVNYGLDYEKRVGCYYSEDSKKGDYSGNRLIFEHKGGYKITDTEELTLFFKNLEMKREKSSIAPNVEESNEKEPEQLSFDDLLMRESNISSNE